MNLGLFNRLTPSSAIIAVTLRCNSRCIMCDIWKSKVNNIPLSECKKAELQPEEYKKLPDTLRTFHITGGEPFLRDDLVDIIRICLGKNPKASIDIATNGLLPEKISRVIGKIIKYAPQVAIGVSIDGLEENHDKIRGVEDGFKRAIDTIKLLKRAGLKRIAMCFTLLDCNIDDFFNVYYLSKKLNVNFIYTIPVDSEIFFGLNKSKMLTRDNHQLKYLIRSLIEKRYNSLQIRSIFHAWFEQTLLYFILTKKRYAYCTAGKEFFYLSPTGDVFPCHIQPYKLGNLRDEKWSEIWNAPLSREIRRKCYLCNDCWQGCTIGDYNKYFFSICCSFIKHKLSLFI